jgi:Rrf2 family protein
MGGGFIADLWIKKSRMFSATAQYAIRALVELAKLPKGEMALGKDIAEQADIPTNYLFKVLLTLRHAGLLDAVRGHTGGYRLSKPPNEIFLIDVVELFDGVRSRPACILDRDRPCQEEGACAAHPYFKQIRAAYLKFLETTHIGMLVTHKGGTGGKRIPKP